MYLIKLISKFIDPLKILLVLLLTSCSSNPTTGVKFNSTNAFNHIATQVSFGPRYTESDANFHASEFIMDQLRQHGWEAEIQEVESMDHDVRNIIGKFGEGHPWIILGTHYDTRLISDRDIDMNKRLIPVTGANDGASGVSILLELARVIPDFITENSNEESTKTQSGVNQIWLVFFDAEDNGNIPGWDWILGSKAFVETLVGQPDAAIIVDMVGDTNLKIYREKNSNQELSAEIWKEAEKLGYSDYFIPIDKYRILDDHVPFIEAGIPAVDIIDFEYPFWHTTEDTLDKVSGKSLQVVGDTLLQWILNKRFD